MNEEITLDDILWQLEKHPIDGDYVFGCKEVKIIYDSIIKLKKENKQLQERIEYLERSNDRREDTIIEQRQEISDLEDNLGRLKEWVKEQPIFNYKNDDDVCNRKTTKIDNLMPKHLSNEFIQQIDKCITHQDIKCIAHKVNEVINYLQHINKEK